MVDGVEAENMTVVWFEYLAGGTLILKESASEHLIEVVGCVNSSIVSTGEEKFGGFVTFPELKLRTGKDTRSRPPSPPLGVGHFLFFTNAEA